MRIVQALYWLRGTMGQMGNEVLIRRLNTILLSPHDGQALREGLSTLSTWMQNMLRPMLKEQDGT